MSKTVYALVFNHGSGYNVCLADLKDSKEDLDFEKPDCAGYTELIIKDKDE